MKKENPLILANKIIKLFIHEKISLNQQLEIIKMVKERIDFCKKNGAEIQQYKLEL
jgi:hypothetical protein